MKTAYRLRQQARATGEARVGKCIIAEMTQTWLPESDVPAVNRVRVAEIEKIIRARHGSYIPDPAGSDDQELCSAYVRAFALSGAGSEVRGWSRRWAPWLHDEQFFVELEAAAEKLASGKRGKFQMLKADNVAMLMRVSLHERTRLELKTIGACDVPKEERAALAKERKLQLDRQRVASKRRIKNPLMRSRSELSKVSISLAKPWEQEGISRSTWYRRQERETIVSRVHNKSTTGDTSVSSECRAISSPSNDEVKSPPPSSQKNPNAQREGQVGFGDQSPTEFQEAAPLGASYRGVRHG
ncbi:hypothetical protein ATCR1_06701 [Agrobacterium tumefaciens CCNWGS0286]|uniref:hypothetical protein n=1 Tax=Agrobacterium tumefaciens TaxID=358 RepID=UPI0002334897|nr:hypothetical protein [Agrobacterium tumefaciens]EHH07535.1 hypothetical protein ATCR1_06701 [Agrobacterium tumefaciens CCNWGS0286]